MCNDKPLDQPNPLQQYNKLLQDSIRSGTYETLRQLGMRLWLGKAQKGDTK
jgi:hypothetical protein